MYNNFYPVQHGYFMELHTIYSIKYVTDKLIKDII